MVAHLDSVEKKAQEIYETWKDQPGYVPWVPYGNALKQDEARDLALKAHESDLELLYAAAQAYGFGVQDDGRFAVIWTESEYPLRSGKGGALWNYRGWGDSAELWNPLADDGDALRLATKLGLSIVNSKKSKVIMVSALAAPTIRVKYTDDPDRAVRRAIVLVAADLWTAVANTRGPDYCTECNTPEGYHVRGCSQYGELPEGWAYL